MSVITEIKSAYRRFTNSPGFTAVALITLALCIGANLVIFAVVDSVLIRPLPFPSANRLVTVVNSFPKAGLDRDGASVASYYERRGNIPSFSHMSAFRYDTANVGEKGAVERMDILRVTPEFFTTLGVGPIKGRSFKEEEMTPQSDDAVVITDAYWRREYAADAGIIGRELWIDGFKKTVVGVLPANFGYLSSEAQIFVPLSTTTEQRRVYARYVSGYEVIARLKPGATLAEAQAQIDANYAAHAAEFPWAKEIADAGFHETVTPLHADHVRAVRPMLLFMQAGALLLLAIGAVNLINLLLIRASGRAKEFAIRQSMGASGRHVVGEVMVETMLLTIAGGLFGLIAGSWGIRLLTVLGANHLPLEAHIGVDGRVAIVFMLGAVVLGLVIAAPIAWFNLHNHLFSTLKSESRGGTTSRASRHLRDIFVVAQITLAFVLLAGAGLLGLSLKHVMAVSPGFIPDHTLTGDINLPWKDYKDDSARLEFADRLVEVARQQPGLLSFGMITDVPVKGAESKSDNDAMTIVGFTYTHGAPPILHNEYGVTGDYFAAMGIPLLEGRFLASADSHSDSRSCVIDEDFARHYWPKGGAVGQRVWEGPPQKRDLTEAFTVVGIVGAVQQKELADRHANGAIYFPYRYRAENNIYFVAHTSLPPTSIADSIRQVVRSIDPGLPVSDLRTMESRIDESLLARRMPALLTGVFALVALLLAAIGTYGVSSYAVAQRRREIGIRMALGAQPRQIRTQFLSIGLRQLAFGAGLGVIGTWFAGKAMTSILFEVQVFDIPMLAGTAIIMGIVSLSACLIPSRRAASLSPMEALAED